MRKSAIKYLSNFCTFLYKVIFRDEMDAGAKSFFKDLSYVGFGALVASVFSFTFNVLVGRNLGPSEYGIFALIQSVSMLLYLPMIQGLHIAMIRYNTEKDDIKTQQSIISTTYIMVFVLTIISLVIYCSISATVSQFFSISLESFYLSIILALMFVFYTLATNTLRSLQKIQVYSLILPIYSTILLSSFLIFKVLGIVSYKSAVFAIYLGYIITGAIIIVNIRGYISFNYSNQWAFKLMKYSGYTLVSAISSIILVNIDKIVLNTYLSLDQVGIYQACSFGTVGMLSFLNNPFITIFFPASAKYDKKAVWEKIKKGSIVILPIIPMISIFSYLLVIYGYHYNISFGLTLLFSLMSIVYVPGVSTLGWFLASFGKNGAKEESYALLLMTPLYAISLYMLVPRYGLVGAVISMMVSSLFIMLINLMSIRRLLYEL